MVFTRNDLHSENSLLKNSVRNMTREGPLRIWCGLQKSFRRRYSTASCASSSITFLSSPGSLVRRMTVPSIVPSATADSPPTHRMLAIPLPLASNFTFFTRGLYSSHTSPMSASM